MQSDSNISLPLTESLIMTRNVHVLTVIGAKAYTQLIAPLKSGEAHFATLSEAMKNHYKPAVRNSTAISF